MILALVTLAGLLLRLRGLALQGFGQDEVGLWYAALSGYEFMHDGPLSAWIYGPFMGVLRRTDSFAFHLPGAVLGTGAILTAFAIGKRLWNERAGLIAALYVALCPLAIEYSQAGRPYSVYELLYGLLFYTFVVAHQNDSWRAWCAFGVIVFLSFLTHLMSVAVLASFAVFLCIEFLRSARQDKSGVRAGLATLTRFAAPSILAAAMGSYWLHSRNTPHMMSVLEGGYSFGIFHFVRTVVNCLGGLLTYSHYRLPNWKDLIPLIFLCAAGAGILKLWWSEKREVAILFVTAILVPLGVVYFNLGPKSNWSWARYFSYLVIPYAVLVGLGLERFFLHSRQVSASAAVALVLLMSPGYLAWARTSVRVRDGRLQYKAAQVRHLAARLNGVILYANNPNLTTLRLTAHYAMYGKDKLPLFHLIDGHLLENSMILSRFNLRTIPEFSDGNWGRSVETLPAGRYALIPAVASADVSCGVLQTVLRTDSKVIDRTASFPGYSVQDPLYLCEVVKGRWW